MSTVNVFDHRVCELGEGLHWHPLRQQLFWFDIIGKKLLSQTTSGNALAWQFDRQVSAAGWIDHDTLLVASEDALLRFDIGSGRHEAICSLEAGNATTRSNDGRADPWGGFWIGTMGKRAEPGAGAIYRYYRGEIRQLYAAITITNAICFSPDGNYGYFADTPKQLIWRQKLAAQDGWPQGQPEIHIDCRKLNVYPDGAVVDQSGCLWNAHWGSASVACYNSDGKPAREISLPATNVTCPGFGGRNLRTLFVSSATSELPAKQLQRQATAGCTFCIETDTPGQREHQVRL